MFTVPGWSLSADQLKPQIKDIIPTPASGSNSQIENGTPKRSRKRKRAHNSTDNGTAAFKENLSDLWERYVEQKETKSAGDDRQIRTKTRKKKREKSKDGTAGAQEPKNRVCRNSQNKSDKIENDEHGDLIRKKKEENRRKEQAEDGEKKNDLSNSTDEKFSRVDAGPSVNTGRSKYEERKSKAIKKREQRSLLPASSTNPPVRSELNLTYVNEPTSLKIPEPLDIPTGANPVASPKTTIAQKEPKAQRLQKVESSSRVPDQLAKLTPLQHRMAAKLTSARFRHLNQSLYTSSSDQAMRLFTEAPQAYKSYHEGFRAQVAVWPQNPVDGFIEDIESRGSVKLPSQTKVWRLQKKSKRSPNDGSTDLSTHGGSLRSKDPLPRDRQGTCTIADLGCGDASLASAFVSSRQALNLDFSSFDLAKGDTPNANLITVADITNLSAVGVKIASVDIAICCLSLMGTNWVSVVDECARVVRAGGEMWVAEIKSRFARVGHEKEKKRDRSSKREKKIKGDHSGDQWEDEEAANLIEVDNVKDTIDNDRTDVSAFVEIFRKRGFDLKGEPDVNNKMFVRMRFVKTSKAERSRENEKGGAARFGDGFKGKQRAATRFLDEEREVDESQVLKPCVYKTR